MLLVQPLFIARSVCLGSLSCWKTQTYFIFNAGRGFPQNVTRAIYGHVNTNEFHPLCRKKHPQRMMFLSPCVTVGMVFLGCNSAIFKFCSVIEEKKYHQHYQEDHRLHPFFSTRAKQLPFTPKGPGNCSASLPFLDFFPSGRRYRSIKN